MFPLKKILSEIRKEDHRFTFFAEEDVNWGNTGKVEDVDAVLDCDLDIGQWVHLLDWASAGHRNRNIQALSSVQHWNVQRLQK